eukprot:scaffold59994_cov68-Phaeocystis_antarctica.AAC.2
MALPCVLQFSAPSSFLRASQFAQKGARACVRLVQAWPDTWRSPAANALGLGLVGAEAAALVLVHLVSASGFRAGAGAFFRGWSAGPMVLRGGG